MWEVWIDLLKVTAGVAGTLGAVYLKNKLEQKQVVKQTILDKSMVYDQLQAIVHHTEVDGALIMKSHNGGGQPYVGSRLYITAIDQLIHPQSAYATKDFKRQFKELSIDKPFIDLLKQMQLEEAVSVVESALPDEDLLKGMLINEGIGYMALFHIYNTKHNMYFMMLIKQDPQMITASGPRARIEVAANRIRGVFEKSYRKQ